MQPVVACFLSAFAEPMWLSHVQEFLLILRVVGLSVCQLIILCLSLQPLVLPTYLLNYPPFHSIFFIFHFKLSICNQSISLLPLGEVHIHCTDLFPFFGNSSDRILKRWR